MDNFTYYAPTEVVFGKGVENNIGYTASKYGKKDFLKQPLVPRLIFL